MRVTLKALATSGPGSRAGGTGTFSPSGNRKGMLAGSVSSQNGSTKRATIDIARNLEAVVTVSSSGDSPIFIQYNPNLGIGGCNSMVTMTGGISVQGYTYKNKAFDPWGNPNGGPK
jgi:hypothetical protein